MDACAQCGTELPAGARFCASCGAPVEERPQVEERKVATVLFELAVARQDEALIRQALGRFEAMGVTWYADETRRLLA